ncbi:hypothetical protein P280DRAFT_471225 [Massarina eburnea CBS 473.64]|uniref:Uncharacterized protein n=1 Tax=Massarina eburnea CBS 473.64 TaxID=1395130 RepID=A0A6A6RXD7_9PLEO|nr:hypothetical protein P280DRAFT_471225 [Massarina eburnea CBS 473.64]
MHRPKFNNSQRSSFASFKKHKKEEKITKGCPRLQIMISSKATRNPWSWCTVPTFTLSPVYRIPSLSISYQIRPSIHISRLQQLHVDGGAVLIANSFQVYSVSQTLTPAFTFSAAA